MAQRSTRIGDVRVSREEELPPHLAPDPQIDASDLAQLHFRRQATDTI